jgi:hypothetical protein
MFHDKINDENDATIRTIFGRNGKKPNALLSFFQICIVIIVLSWIFFFNVNSYFHGHSSILFDLVGFPLARILILCKMRPKTLIAKPQAFVYQRMDDFRRGERALFSNLFF